MAATTSKQPSKWALTKPNRARVRTQPTQTRRRVALLIHGERWPSAEIRIEEKRCGRWTPIGQYIHVDADGLKFLQQELLRADALLELAKSQADDRFLQEKRP